MSNSRGSLTDQQTVEILQDVLRQIMKQSNDTLKLEPGIQNGANGRATLRKIEDLVCCTLVAMEERRNRN